MNFSRMEAWLTLVGSETLDSNLGIFIPKQGLHTASADKFAKTNEIKTIEEDEKHNPTQIKT